MSLPPALRGIPRDQPVLIAGPTASGKSELALRLSETQGGVILNADASQVYGCWRVISARPGPDDLRRAPHLLYGHVDWRTSYSAGDWLREVAPLLCGAQRPIIVGGTGLYMTLLTQGIARIPPTDPAIRAEADQLELDTLLRDLDAETRAQIDTANRARVQRAWEVLRQTGEGFIRWQGRTDPPALPIERCVATVLDAPKDWLEPRIFARFGQMVEHGAVEEVAAMQTHFDPSLPAFRAIGVPEILSYLEGRATIDTAMQRAAIATRQFAKRQRTWFRSKMSHWTRIDASTL